MLRVMVAAEWIFIGKNKLKFIYKHLLSKENIIINCLVMSVFLILRRVFGKNPNIFCKNLWRTPPIDHCWIPTPFSITKSLSMHRTWYKWDSADHNFHGSVMQDHFHMVSIFINCEVYLFALFYFHHFLIDCSSEGWKMLLQGSNLKKFLVEHAPRPP